MNTSERDLLMRFLQELASSPTKPGDPAANNLIQDAIRHQPNANYLLVQRALALECELATARHRILELEGKADAASPAPLVTDFLNPQTAQWGEPGDGAVGVTTSKMLYDIFIGHRESNPRDLESKALSFIGRYTVQIWLVLLAIVASVVLFKEKLV